MGICILLFGSYFPFFFYAYSCWPNSQRIYLWLTAGSAHLQFLLHNLRFVFLMLISLMLIYRMPTSSIVGSLVWRRFERYRVLDKNNRCPYPITSINGHVSSLNFIPCTGFTFLTIVGVVPNVHLIMIASPEWLMLQPWVISMFGESV